MNKSAVLCAYFHKHACTAGFIIRLSLQFVYRIYGEILDFIPSDFAIIQLKRIIIIAKEKQIVNSFQANFFV